MGDGLWRHPAFRNLWLAVVVSTYGSLVRATALAFTAILVLDASPAEIGALRIAEMLPGFLFGLLAGAWVDRVRRRPLMIATDLARALALASIPLAAVLGWLGFPQLFIVAALVSALGVFFDVAYQSYLPSLVRNEALVEANSRLTAGVSVVEALAFSTGGWLVQLLTAPMALLADAVSFVGSAFFVGAIRTPEPAPAAPDAKGAHLDRPVLTRFAHEVVEGLQAVWQQPLLRGMTLASAAQNAAFGLIGTVFLLYLNQEVGFNPGILGMIFAVGGVSAFAGALLAGRLPRVGVGVVMIVSLLLAAIGEAFIPLATSVSAVSVALLVAQQIVGDAALTIYEINQVSLRQAITPGAVLGRVNASVRVTESGAVLLGIVAASALGESVGLRAILWVAVALSLSGSVMLFFSPVRQLARIPNVPDEVS